MADRPFNVLFLCTGNSARSILAEAILNRLGAGKFRAYSAGSQPKGQVNPHALTLLQSLDYDTSGFCSKSWSEFARPGAPALDFVFTVCDNAAGEACPVWPGQPMTAHWGVADPAEATGTPAQVALAFKDAYRMLHQRIAAFAALADSQPGSAQPAGAPERDRAHGRRNRKGCGNHVMPPVATPRGRSARHGVPARHRDRLGHHGAEAVRRKSGAGAARQHLADRRDPRGADPDVRADIRRASQSGRQPGLRPAPRIVLAGRGRLHRRRSSSALLPASGSRM